MRLKPQLSLVLIAALSGAFVSAQQPDGGAPPGGPGQRGPKTDQGRGGWGVGMRPGFQIGPPGIWWHNPDLVQKLALTPDQQKRMDDILQQSRLQLVDLRANVEKQEVSLEKVAKVLTPFFERYNRYLIADTVKLPEGYEVREVDVTVNHGTNGISIPAHLRDDVAKRLCRIAGAECSPHGNHRIIFDEARSRRLLEVGKRCLV